MGVSEFKARCLQILDELHAQGGELVLTRHGKAVARVTAVGSEAKPLRGLWKDLVIIRSEIVPEMGSDL